MKRWFIKWGNTNAGAAQKELAMTLEDRRKAEAMLDYIETTDGLKLMEYREVE